VTGIRAHEGLAACKNCPAENAGYSDGVRCAAATELDRYRSGCSIASGSGTGRFGKRPCTMALTATDLNRDRSMLASTPPRSIKAEWCDK